MRLPLLAAATFALFSLLPIGGRAQATDPAALPDSAYVTVSPDGHLQKDGRRVRYWGFIGFVAGGGAGFKLGDTPDVRTAKEVKRKADVDLMVQRIGDLGFNMVRSWDGEDEVRPGFSVFLAGHDYACGDGSPADVLAYYFAQLDRKGIKVWMSSLDNLGPVSSTDVNAVDDPATADAWKAALAEWEKKKGGAVSLRDGLPRLLDTRMEALAIRRYREGATWPNRYKDGLRLCDDPQVAVWEINNEELLYRSLFNGDWQTVPPFFRNELLARWTAYLRGKYGTDEKLRVAWKFLVPGESLAGTGTVLLAPLASPVRPDAAVNDTNPDVIARLKVAKHEYSRDDFTRARGEDVVEFFTQVVIEHKQRFANALKTIGRSCRLSPCLWDTGNQFQIQSQFMMQQSDAVATCAYTSNWGDDPKARRYPFFSPLDDAPRLCWDVPWFEQSAVVGKPHFVYEVQTKNTSKYRAEFPWEVVSIAAIEDWDIINWHIYGFSADSSKPRPFDAPLAIWHDFFQYGNDEVQTSAMRAASECFKGGLIAPAPRPTVFTFGRHSLYDPASMDYSHSYGYMGNRFIPTCYRYGVRVKIDPTRPDDVVDGPSIRQGVFQPNPVRPNDEIEYDWHRSHLKMDAPAVAAYAGFLAQYGSDRVVFAHSGTVFRDVSVRNPAGMPFPVRSDEKYVALSLVSRDGLSLARTRRAILSAVSTSFNTGYKLDLTHHMQGMMQQGPGDGPPGEFVGPWISDGGKEPVIVARVGVTVQNPALAGMRYVLRDWNMHVLGRGVVPPSGVLTVSAAQPVFFTELER